MHTHRSSHANRSNEFHPQANALLLGVLAAVVIGGGCTPIQVQPASVVVEGRISGQDANHQPTADAVVTLRHANAGGGRTSYTRDIPIQDVESAHVIMTASTGLPFAEEWHLLHVSRPTQRPGNDATILEFSADPGFVRSHTGDLAWVTLRRHDVALPSGSFSDFATPSPRAGGALIMGRVEDDDPVLPWTSPACAATGSMPLSATLRPLAPAGGSDCFDMQSLASMLLNQIAITVTNAARDQDARAVSHSLAIVPHIATPPVGAASSAPGVGFIYQTTLQPNGAAAAFSGSLTLTVPITWVFRRLPDGTLVTALDPLTVAVPGTVLGNAPRVTVFATDGTLAAAFAEDLRSSVLAAILAAPIPTGPANIPVNAFLDLLLATTVLQGENSLPPDFSVLALPANRSVAGAPNNTAIRMGEIRVRVRIGVIPGAPGGAGARAVAIGNDGRVRVSQNMDAGGSHVRTFVLPAPAEPLPFNLVVQR